MERMMVNLLNGIHGPVNGINSMDMIIESITKKLESEGKDVEYDSSYIELVCEEYIADEGITYKYSYQLEDLYVWFDENPGASVIPNMEITLVTDYENDYCEGCRYGEAYCRYHGWV